MFRSYIVSHSISDYGDIGTSEEIRIKAPRNKERKIMLSQRHLKKAEDLSKSSEILDNDANYQKALRFADDDLKKQLLGISNQRT